MQAGELDKPQYFSVGSFKIIGVNLMVEQCIKQDENNSQRAFVPKKSDSGITSIIPLTLKSLVSSEEGLS